MSLKTHSKFYYGFEVDADNLYLDFDEGGPEFTALIDIGSYTLTEFLAEVQTALNATGANIYTVSVDRVTRLVTIAADHNFTLRLTSGSHAGSSVFGLLGFAGADVSGAATYTGASPVGSVYSTQFVIQSYVDAEDQPNASYGTVNKAASGKIEVVTYGSEAYFDMEFKYITDIFFEDGGPIRNNPSGVSDLRAFMTFLITKGSLEFMPDEDQPNVFTPIYLEGTPEDSSMGLKFKLKEQYGRGLPGFFETGVLKFRRIDDA